LVTKNRNLAPSVKIEEVGDSSFLLEQQVDKFRFREEKDRVIANGGRPAVGRPLLLGITRASLSTESFISAASFQETTRILTEASINGAVDNLRGPGKTSSSADSSPPEPAWNTTATSSSHRSWKKRQQKSRPKSKPSIEPGRTFVRWTIPPPPTPWCGMVVDLAGVGLGVDELDNLRVGACI
jgi:hypothetical protein